MSRTPKLITINVAAPPAGSTLQSVAQAMAVGTWAEVSSLNTTAVLCNGGGNGGNVIPYQNQGMRDVLSPKKIVFYGGDHGATEAPFYKVTYDDATNTWSRTPTGFFGFHGFGHNAYRPDTGDYYFRFAGGGVAPENTVRELRGSGSLTTFTASPATYTQIGVGCCWWPGSNTGKVALSGVGAAGCYLITEISLGVIMVFDPLSSAWSLINVPATYPPVDPYHTLMAYSATYNCAVYGGGNGNRRLFRLNQDRTVDEFPQFPTNIGIQAANLTTDPVTGKFLVWGSGRRFWVIDPSNLSNPYTEITATRSPPARGLHGVSDPSIGNPDSLVSIPLPDLGVICYLSADGASYANMFLYKHA